MGQHRYILEKYQSGKPTRFDCPQCGPEHRKTFSRYIDPETNEALGEHVGRCNREVNCGYHYTPKQHFEATHEGSFRVDKTKTYRLSRSQHPMEKKIKNEMQVVDPTIPVEVFKASRKGYNHNAFVTYLLTFTDADTVSQLISRYHIGTSKRWDGATIFWWVTPNGTVVGGQVVLFGPDGHTAKYTDSQGNTQRCTRPLHKILLRQYQEKKLTAPDWLTEYEQQGEKFPTLFGLHLLRTEPATKPIAIAEAPATAIVASVYFPQFIWLAAGSLSWLNEKRLSPLKGRKVILFPDLNAYDKWSKVADTYSHLAHFTASNFLERKATDEERKQGLDLRDYLTRFDPSTFHDSKKSIPSTQRPLESQITPTTDEPSDSRLADPLITQVVSPLPIISTIAEQVAHPGSILKPDESQIERLTVEASDSYPAAWDNPSPSDAKPTIKSVDFFEWQRHNKYFSQLGLSSLKTEQS